MIISLYRIVPSWFCNLACALRPQRPPGIQFWLNSSCSTKAVFHKESHLHAHGHWPQVHLHPLQGHEVGLYAPGNTGRPPMWPRLHPCICHIYFTYSTSSIGARGFLPARCSQYNMVRNKIPLVHANSLCRCICCLSFLSMHYIAAYIIFIKDHLLYARLAGLSRYPVCQCGTSVLQATEMS